MRPHQRAKRRRRCPWCDDTGRYVRSSGFVLVPGLQGVVTTDAVPCKHPPCVVVRARPGAEFRTTKFVVAKPKDGQPANRGKPASAWRPPADVGRDFAETVAGGHP